jgi:hypothetical protein
MNDYLAESRGTLARTAQKKQTAISVYHRQQQLRKKEEKYGFAVRPANPNIVERPDAVEFYFKEVYGETSNKIAQLQHLDASAIDREGEGPIRRLNKEANELISERARWGRRLVDVGGSVPQAQLNPAKKMVYFGAAKYLPEAVAYLKAEAEAQAARAEKKRQSGSKRERGEEGSETSDDNGDLEEMDWGTVNEQPDPMVQASGTRQLNDEDESSLVRRTNRWLPLDASNPAVASAPALIEGFMGLEYTPEDERRLRQVEATALQKHWLGSGGGVQRKPRPSEISGSPSSSHVAEENDEEGLEYNPLKERTASVVKSGEAIGIDKSAEGHSLPPVAGHLGELAASLLSMAVHKYHDTSSDEGGQRDTTLVSEKEVQARVFAAKKALMLQQLNRKKSEAQK